MNSTTLEQLLYLWQTTSSNEVRKFAAVKAAPELLGTEKVSDFSSYIHDAICTPSYYFTKYAEHQRVDLEMFLALSENWSGTLEELAEAVRLV